MSDQIEIAADFVRRAVDHAEARLAPHSGSGLYDIRRAIMKQVAKSLTDTLGARIKDDWNGARVRIQGVQATSTSGLIGALRNWLAAVERKRA